MVPGGGPPPYSAATAASARLKRPLPDAAAPDDKSRIKEEPMAPSAPKRMNMGPKQQQSSGPQQAVIKTEVEDVAVKSEVPSSVTSSQSSVRFPFQYYVVTEI